jgi:hypothetical protein
MSLMLNKRSHPRSDPASHPTQPTARPFAPMSDLLDDLVKLARSAAQMKSKPAAPDRPSLKRMHQTSLTKDGHLSEMGTLAKVRRLD